MARMQGTVFMARPVYKVGRRGTILKQKRNGVASGDLKLQCIRNCHVF